MKRLRAPLALVVATVVAGCSEAASTPPASPGPNSPGQTGPVVTVSVRGGCPEARHDRAFGDIAPGRTVRNSGDDLDAHLLPTDEEPTGGLVCRYPGQRLPGEPAERLVVRLDAARARTLAASVRTAPLTVPPGAYSCPADTLAAAVIAFAYPHRRDVDLYFADTGCTTITNGRVTGYLYGPAASGTDFATTFDALAR